METLEKTTTLRNAELSEMVRTLEALDERKYDTVVGSSALRASVDDEIRLYVFADQRPMASVVPNRTMTTQLASRLRVPQRYFDRMASQLPELATTTINEWLRSDAYREKNWLIRTYTRSSDARSAQATPWGWCSRRLGRAFLSNAYKLIDNLDVMYAILRVLEQSGIVCRVEQSDVGETHMRLRVRATNVRVRATNLLDGYMGQRAGDELYVNPSIVVSNSEVGAGRFKIAPRIYVPVCANGLIAERDAFSRVHLGERMDEGAVDWSEETRQRHVALIESQTADVVDRFLSSDFVESKLDELESLRSVRVRHTVQGAANVGSILGMTDDEKERLLQHFLQDGDQSALGMAQAVTRVSQHSWDADHAYELESGALEIARSVKRWDRSTPLLRRPIMEN